MAELGDLVLIRPRVSRVEVRNLTGRVIAIRNDAGRAGEKQVCVDLAPLRGHGEHYFIDDADVIVQVQTGRG